MKKILILSLLVIFAIGCKKENRIERNLWKGGGEWNMVKWTNTSTSSFYPQDNYSETIHNAGVIKFNKDGSGSLTFTGESSAYSEIITYQNTENTLTIFDSDGDGTIFDLDWERNELTLTRNDSETYTSYDGNGDPVVVNATDYLLIECEKK